MNPAPTLSQITKELLSTYNRFPRKRLGQHFLIDPQVLQRIIAAAKLTPTDLVVEIGSGLGVVTAEIAKAAGRVIGIEVDKELVEISRQVLSPLKNVEIVQGDILDIDLSPLLQPPTTQYKIIGNLPYYITAPIVERIIKARTKPEIAVIMVQKEVAQRMSAAPGKKAYGSFSIFCQLSAAVEIDSFVSKSSFLPWPEVGSALVVLRPYRAPKFQVNDEKRFFDIVHAAFQQRRKKLRNSLAKFNLAGQLVDLSRRPEELSIEEFVALANSVRF